MADPRSVKHYEILARLGAGGMGVVYRARDTRLGRVVALKMLHGELVHDEERERRFEREARIVSSLSHPGIATLYDFDREGEAVFLTMELIEGPTLRELLRDGPLDASHVLDCALQVAEALAAAHRAGVVHRDLKPENIMRTPAGFYKVLDFGVARVHELAEARDAGTTEVDTRSWVTSAGELVGTVAYMSPEQVLGRPVDARSDLFAFGSLLHEMCTGRQLFRGANALATADAIVHRDPASLREARADLPDGLDAVARACLAKQPERRYASADDLAEDLRTLRDDARTDARRRLIATAGARRRRTGLVAAAALTLVAAAVLAALLVGRPRESAPDRPGSGLAADPLPSLPQRPRVVVASFENQSGDPDAERISRGLPEMLTTDLSRARELEVISSLRFRELAASTAGDAALALDRASAAALARWTGADLVVGGGVFKLGDVYRIDAQAYDTATGTVRVAQKVEGRDLFRLVNELTAGLLQGLRMAAGAPGIEAVPTTSQDAFRRYAEAKECFEKLDLEGAAEGYRAALELDPGFDLARLELAQSLAALGDGPGAAEAARPLVEPGRRLTDSERLLARALRAFYADGDVAAGSELLDELVRRFPAQGPTYVIWARVLADLGRDPLAAASKLRQAIEQDPNNLLAIATLASELRQFGQNDAAEEILRDAARRHPRAVDALRRVAEAPASTVP